LDNNNISCQNLNVAEDKAALDEMIDKSGQMSVPVIEIDGDLMIGFDEAQLKQRLGL